MFGRQKTKFNFMFGDPEYERQVMKAFDMKPKKKFSLNPLKWRRHKREQREYELFLFENKKFELAKEKLESELLLLAQFHELGLCMDV